MHPKPPCLLHSGVPTEHKPPHANELDSTVLTASACTPAPSGSLVGEDAERREARSARRRSDQTLSVPPISNVRSASSLPSARLRSSARSMKSTERQLSARTASTVQHLVPPGWDVQHCKTHVWRESPRPRKSDWRITRPGETAITHMSITRRWQKASGVPRKKAEVEEPGPPPCPTYPPGVPDGFGGWSSKLKKNEAYKHLSEQSIAEIYDDTTPPEKLWVLEGPPWVWKPVERPEEAISMALVVKIPLGSGTLRMQLLQRDPESESVWAQDPKLKPVDIPLSRLWHVRAEVTELPPSGMDRRWMVQGGSL